MSNIKWNYDSVKVEALKFDTSGEFRKGNPRAYDYACRHNILKDFFDNIQRTEWSEEEIRQEALKYNSKNAFKRGCNGAYQSALRKHMIDDLFANKLHYWTDDEIRKISLNYKSKRDLKLNCPSAYGYAVRNHLIDELFENVYESWDYEKVKEIARKCKTKKEFYQKYDNAYQYACRNNLLDMFTWLVDEDGVERCVYAYIDDDNKVAYVGLTLNKEERHKSHSTGLFKDKKTYSAVFDYFNKIGKEVPEPIYLEENLSAVDAQKMEDLYVKKYEKMGYIMLNKGATGVGTGSIGFHKWSKKLLIKEASKYNTKIELYHNNRGAYDYAVNHGFIDELYDNVKRTWDDESVRKEALKYKNKYRFKLGCSGAYNYAERHKMLDELFNI